MGKPGSNGVKSKEEPKGYPSKWDNEMANDFQGEWEDVPSGEFVQFNTPGDVVIGIYIRVKDGPNGVIHELDDSGERRLLPSNKILIDKMAEIPMGSLVRIKFLGETKSKTSPFAYKEFDVKFKRSSRDK